MDIKSPLRFPGGKSKVAELIASYFPEGITEMVSPFFGGGGVELWTAQNGIRVWGYDGFKPLVAFWQELLQSDYTRNQLIADIQEYFPLSKADFKECQKELRENIEISRRAAILFFVLNRASFSGTTLSGGCTLTPSEGKNARFTESSIDKLIDFIIFPRRMLSVGYSLWPDTLAAHSDLFAYLDPPYLIGPKIYGVKGDMHRGFDHQGLATALKARDAPWLLSYNDCPEVREWYKGFTIETAEWSNSMGGNDENGKAKRQKEVLIRNY